MQNTDVEDDRQDTRNVRSALFVLSLVLPNKEWSSFLSPAAEIQAYLCRLCDDENLRSQIKANHLVTGAYWDEGPALWTVRIKDLHDNREFKDHCDFLLDASGILKYVHVP